MTDMTYWLWIVRHCFVTGYGTYDIRAIRTGASMCYDRYDLLAMDSVVLLRNGLRDNHAIASLWVTGNMTG